MLRKALVAREMKVVLEADGGGWHVHLPEVAGCRSHGRSIAEARRNIREALSLCEDVLPGASGIASKVTFVEEIRIPRAAQRAMTRALKARVEAQRKDEEAAKTAAEGARELRRAGLSLRDAGLLLQLSHQRIKQLTE